MHFDTLEPNTVCMQRQSREIDETINRYVLSCRKLIGSQPQSVCLFPYQLFHQTHAYQDVFQERNIFLITRAQESQGNILYLGKRRRMQSPYLGIGVTFPIEVSAA